MAARDGALPTASLLAGLRSEALHGWQPPGGGMEGALTHCVIHGLDITEAVPLERRVPDERIARVLGIVGGLGGPNLFGVDLSGVELRADDLDWSCGSGAPVTGPAQTLALVLCGRLLPAGRLGGDGGRAFHPRLRRSPLRRPTGPTRSAAREKPSWRSEDAARLDAYPSEHTMTICCS